VIRRAILIFAAAGALEILGCAVAEPAAKFMFGLWASEVNHNTVDSFNWQITTLDLKPDGTFVRTNRQVQGNRDRRHPRAPAELLITSGGTWGLDADGTYWQRLTYIGTNQIVAAETVRLQLRWHGQNAVEMLPIGAATGTMYVRQ
jgi:hypothetical protein